MFRWQSLLSPTSKVTRFITKNSGKYDEEESEKILDIFFGNPPGIGFWLRHCVMMWRLLRVVSVTKLRSFTTVINPSFQGLVWIYWKIRNRFINLITLNSVATMLQMSLGKYSLEFNWLVDRWFSLYNCYSEKSIYLLSSRRAVEHTFINHLQQFYVDLSNIVNCLLLLLLSTEAWNTYIIQLILSKKEEKVMSDDKQSLFPSMPHCENNSNLVSMVRSMMEFDGIQIIGTFARETLLEIVTPRTQAEYWYWVGNSNCFECLNIFGVPATTAAFTENWLSPWQRQFFKMTNVGNHLRYEIMNFDAFVEVTSRLECFTPLNDFSFLFWKGAVCCLLFCLGTSVPLHETEIISPNLFNFVKLFNEC